MICCYGPCPGPRDCAVAVYENESARPCACSTACCFFIAWTVAASVVLSNTDLATPVMAASCQANESCGVGQDCSICAEADDCRQCANFTTNLECVSRDSCIWDQGTLPAYPITAADIVFVVAPIVCGLYTLDGFLRHDGDDANWTRSGAHIFLIICSGRR